MLQGDKNALEKFREVTNVGSFTGFMPDQVWMAVTHEGSDHATFLCYRGTVGLMQKANPSQFRYGDLQYWNSVLTLGSIEKVEGELYLKDNAKE